MNKYENSQSTQEVVGAALQPKKESITVRELNLLSQATSGLIQETERLEHMLGSVLLAEPKPEINGQEEETLSEVPSQIRQHRRTVDAAAGLIRSMLERLEI